MATAIRTPTDGGHDGGRPGGHDGGCPRRATHPGTNGRIAFLRWDADGVAQMWPANPDLIATRWLTHGAVNSGWPAWSPDGSRITFDSDRFDPDHRWSRRQRRPHDAT